MNNAKGFFASLFDFSFTAFVTAKIIKVLYGLAIVGVGLLTLMSIVGGFSESVPKGLLMLLVGGPLIFLVGIIYSRVLLEIIMVIFRIAESTAEIAEQGRRGPTQPSSE